MIWPHKAGLVGEFYYRLTFQRDWVKRRVETIELLDRSRIERHITFDIDVDAVHGVGTDCGLKFDGSVLVPIAVLRKRLLLDVDVSDESGSRLPIAVSDEDAEASFQLLLALLKRDVERLLPVPKGAAERMRRIVRYDSRQLYANLVYSVFGGQKRRLPGLQPLVDLNLAPEELAFWSEALRLPGFRAALVELSISYLLLVPVSALAGTKIIKLRYVDQLFPTSLRPLQQLSLAAVVVPIDVSGVGFAAREHTRIVAPLGMRLHDIELREGRSRKAVDSGTYERRLTFDRAVIYTSGLSRGPYVAWVKMFARGGAFTVPALLSTAVMAVLAFLVGYQQLLHALQLQGAVHPAPDNLKWLSSGLGSTVALLTLIPSLTAAYFVRPGEHELVGRLLSLPRLLVIIGALSVLATAAGLAFGSADWVLHSATVAFVLNAVLAVFSLLGLARVEIAVMRRQNSIGYNQRRRWSRRATK